MKKNKLFCKLLGVVSAISMICSVGMANNFVFADSTSAIIRSLTRHEIEGISGDQYAFIDSLEIGGYKKFFGYIDTDPDVKAFREAHAEERGMKDSFDFLFLMHFIVDRVPSAFRDSLLKRLISCRSRAELRDDKYYADEFDFKFDAGLKMLLTNYSSKVVKSRR